MKDIENKSIDMILADLPYGITDNAWDTVIPFDKLWSQYNRIIKDNGCIALFGQEPFSSKLRMSNEKMYRYDWIWVKSKAVGFLQSHKMPLRKHENISIFYKHLPIYNPQMRLGFKPYCIKNNPTTSTNYKISAKSAKKYKGSKSSGDRYPIDVIDFKSISRKGMHPTQKPVALLKYLIKTYTNNGGVVLDNTMGSGSTGVACVETGRDFIGMELDEEYFEIAKNRINEAQNAVCND
ncbi:site-specific DNA-methyltransferase [Lactobacillus sp. ESL0230]|uniref:DNA-methyltransferase n=1 Tax=Lactobacillus sp. ESL0230 TaxID=2069353 RepID=UPI000EFA42EF|nr:site-specific DNA-methyltransferase [Lactobacillus sp. ESL0230]RMC46851.1 site-specific DNA-methyltransferase [Lactobacillus sp. ESL0230]